MAPSYKIFVILCLRLPTAILVVRAFLLFSQARLLNPTSYSIWSSSAYASHTRNVDYDLTISTYTPSILRSFFSMAGRAFIRSTAKSMGSPDLCRIDLCIIGARKFCCISLGWAVGNHSYFLPHNPIIFIDIGPSPTDFSK